MMRQLREHVHVVRSCDGCNLYDDVVGDWNAGLTPSDLWSCMAHDVRVHAQLIRMNWGLRLALISYLSLLADGTSVSSAPL